MRKKLFGLALFALCAQGAQAQISKGGLPLSVLEKQHLDYVPVITASLPDLENGLKEWNAVADPKPALVALMTPLDVKFPASGALYTLDNGNRIWTARIKVAGAKALGTYFDKFKLPEGVTFYLSNSNGRQVLGAYTASNNDETGMFAIEPVEGSEVTLELNIKPSVNLSDIQLSINRAASYFTGISHLGVYQDLIPLDAYDSQLTGGSSVCMINAVCPLGNGYEAQRNAVGQILIPVGGGVGVCSGTMMNTAANTPANCKQYFLIATHCEFGNAVTDAGFNQVILRFNYQQSVCAPAANTIPNTQHTMTGAKFVARSVLPLLPNGQPDAMRIKGDFLLLELKSALPDSWNMNLAGWNNAANIPLTNTAPKKFIGFHHPGGDVKKVSTTYNIANFSLGASDSHWKLSLDSGLAAQGSSGSGLFDGDGRVIGVASVAAPGGLPAACNLNLKNQNVSQSTAKEIYYSKFSYVWDYDVDGTADNRKLRPWLNPANTNVTTINMVKSNCNPLGGGSNGITIDNDKLDQSINVFPNPSTGKTVVQVNLSEPADLSFELYDISGRKLNAYKMEHVQKGNFDLDLTPYTSGMYLLKFSNGYHSSSKKIMIQR